MYVLYLAWQSPGYFSLGDLLLILAATQAGIALVYLLAAAVFRDRAEGRLPALIAFAAVVVALGFPVLFTVLHGLPRAPRLGVTAAASLSLVALAVYGLARRPALLRSAATLLTLTMR